MKYLKRFNEGIIEYDSDNIKKFEQETSLLNRNESTFEKIKEIGERNDIEVVTYKEFYDELPDSDKSTSPPDWVPVFALVNPDTNKCRIVLNLNMVSKETIKMMNHMIKHENIHISQNNKRNIKFTLPDPKNREAYFSNKDEVMAFSQSISDMVMDLNPRDLKSAVGAVKITQLYRDIKNNVNADILKRYKKYIYLYLQKEFDKIKK